MFPALAGMNRKKPAANSMRHRVPRARGDEPIEVGSNTYIGACSPRSRG